MSIRQFSRISFVFPVVALLIACNGIHTPPASIVTDAPTVSMVVPQSNGVGTNRKIAVVCAPWKGTGRLRVKVPPGNWVRSTRKQSERRWRKRSRRSLWCRGSLR
jgi:hypothetical protein